ncbi:hypothetical protein HDZ31DRAFT_42404 [Schizophyllum fasciatum]
MFTATVCNSPESSGEGKKKRKSACDYCKSKRVICHPQPEGESCPRCKEKGVQCTTTIAPKRTRGKGKKTLEQEAIAAGLPPPVSEPRASRRAQSSALGVRRDSPESPPLVLPSALIQDAFDIFARFPPAQNPLFATDALRAALAQAEWDPARLDGPRRVLTQCILAFSALVSVDPYFVGCDAQGARFPDGLVQFDALNSPVGAPVQSNLGGIDISELGRRRQGVSRRLHEEALRLAKKEGIATHVSIENVASCFLLDCIDAPDDPADRMSWAAAYVWQFRSLTESGKLEWQHSITTFKGHLVRLQWRGSLMALALYALSIDKSPPFSASDEETICGPTNTSFEDALARAPSLSPEAAGVLLMNSPEVGNLSVRSSDTLIGTFVVAARRRPLDDAAVSKMLSTMDLFQASASRFRAYILSLGDGPDLRMCLHACALALGTTAVYLHRALEARALDRPDMVLQRRAARELAVRAVVKGSVDVRRAMSPYRLRFKQFSGLAAWVAVLVGDRSGVVGLDERVEALVRLRHVVKFSSFAGVDLSETVDAIDAELNVLCVASASQSSEGSPEVWSDLTPSDAWPGMPMDPTLAMGAMGGTQGADDGGALERVSSDWSIYLGGTGMDLPATAMQPIDTMFIEAAMPSNMYYPDYRGY